MGQQMVTLCTILFSWHVTGRAEYEIQAHTGDPTPSMSFQPLVA